MTSFGKFRSARSLGVACRLAALVALLPGCIIDESFPGLLISTAGEWETRAPMLSAREGFGGAVVNGKIYVIGGDVTGVGVEEYDPATDTWTQKNDAPFAGAARSSAAVDGKIYVYDSGAASMQEYDPLTDSWPNCGGNCASNPFRQNLGGELMVAEAGRIFLFGGSQNNLPFTFVNEFTPATGTWTDCGGSCPTMPTAREGSFGSAVNGKIFVLGGVGNGDVTTVMEEFDVAGLTWTTNVPIPFPPHARGASTVVNGRIYTSGGVGANREIRIYDPEVEIWVPGKEMLTDRIEHLSFTIDNVIYMVGGDSTLMSLEALVLPGN